MGEYGSMNLFGFISNNPLNVFDILGLYESCTRCHIDVRNEMDSYPGISPPETYAGGVVSGVIRGGIVVTGFIVTATFSVPVALTAGGALLIYNATDSVGRRYYEENQTIWQTAGGTFTDVTGINGIYIGVTDKDIATSQTLNLSDFQRGEELSCGCITAALILSSGRIVAKSKGVDYSRYNAEQLYDMIRNTTNDVEAISIKYRLKSPRLHGIKDYLFYIKTQSPNFKPHKQTALAWCRLSRGKATTTDFLLLKHEAREILYNDWIKNNPIKYEQKYGELDSHDISNMKYDWEQHYPPE